MIKIIIHYYRYSTFKLSCLVFYIETFKLVAKVSLLTETEGVATFPTDCDRRQVRTHYRPSSILNYNYVKCASETPFFKMEGGLDPAASGL